MPGDPAGEGSGIAGAMFGHRRSRLKLLLQALHTAVDRDHVRNLRHLAQHPADFESSDHSVDSIKATLRANLQESKDEEGAGGSPVESSDTI